MTKPPATSGWTGGRVVAVVFGAVLVLTSLGLITGGIGTFVVNGTLRDGGYLTSLERDVSSNGYAVVVDDVVVHAPGPDSVLPARLVGDIRVRADGAAATPVFVGIARTSDVTAYLGDVQRDVLQHHADDHVDHHADHHADHQGRMGDGWGRGWARDRMGDWGPMLTRPGTSPSGPPAAQGFWAAQASGTGAQSIVWTPQRGTWTLVVMNADGSQPVGASVDVGATVPWLPWLGGGLVALGVVLALGGALLILIPTQRASREH